MMAARKPRKTEVGIGVSCRFFKNTLAAAHSIVSFNSSFLSLRDHARCCTGCSSFLSDQLVLAKSAQTAWLVKLLTSLKGQSVNGISVSR
jgi:hypothetical protein